MKSLILSLLVLLTASCLAACHTSQRTYDRQVTAPPGGHLMADLSIGSVSVTGGDTDQVTVHASLRGPDALLDRLSIRVKADTSGVTVIEEGSHDMWPRWPLSARIHFAIQVPRDYSVTVRTAGGSLDLQGLHAAVEGSTAGGSVAVRDIQGSVNVHTYGGGMTAEHIEGPARLETFGGGIRVKDCTGDVDARTMGGGIQLAGIDGRVHAETAGGGVTAEVLGEHDITLLTSGGGISLRVPATIHASLDASTVGGSVRSGIALSTTESSGHAHLQGTIGGPGHTIHLHTSGGNIRLEPLA